MTSPQAHLPEQVPLRTLAEVQKSLAGHSFDSLSRPFVWCLRFGHDWHSIDASELTTASADYCRRYLRVRIGAAEFWPGSQKTCRR